MTDSYTFNTPIGFLTIREEEQKLTELFWEANSVQTMKNELHRICFPKEIGRAHV